jgi:hypothetical protein
MKGTFGIGEITFKLYIWSNICIQNAYEFRQLKSKNKEHIFKNEQGTWIDIPSKNT